MISQSRELSNRVVHGVIGAARSNTFSVILGRGTMGQVREICMQAYRSRHPYIRNENGHAKLEIAQYSYGTIVKNVSCRGRYGE